MPKENRTAFSGDQYYEATMVSQYFAEKFLPVSVSLTVSLNLFQDDWRFKPELLRWKNGSSLVWYGLATIGAIPK